MSKEYIDQAVQTEPPRHLSRSDNPKSLNVHPIEDAYSRPLNPKKPSQLGQLSKPSEAALSTRRIVSLPESSPPHRLKPTNERYRVASMSEAHPVKTVTVCGSADSSLSSECFESSPLLDSSRSFSDVYSNRPQISSSLVNVAFTNTPSPPSSPESSIMIIGNHVQVSNHFLSIRPKIEYDYKQERDWTTWSDSPPRPIPALHGPLSLPYARCPSGAEGILVEGEDLSHMIWGLRQGELNSSGYRETLGAKPPNAPTRDTTQPHHYLETPSSLASSSPAFKLRENEAYQPSPPLLTPRDTEPWWHECDDNDDSPIIIPPTPQQLKNFLELQHIFESARPENATGDPGLGLFWPGPKSGPIEIDSLHRQLQASAPIFIPNSKISWQTPDLIPTSNPGATRKRSISAMDIATEYVLQKQAKNTLITPPDSTSAQWTSRFPDLSSLMSDDTLHAVVFEGQSHSRHEPVLCLDQRYTPEELLVENQATKCDVPSKDFLTNMNFNRIDDPFLNPLDPAIESYSPTFSKSGNEPLSATISTPQSPEVRIGNARTIVPQPRSVPFARLLQRRLSAVPEEESGRRMQSVSNAPSPQPLRTRRPGFQNGAQAPNKPYFAQASQNQPDISNKAPVAPSSPIPSDVRRTPRSRVLTASAVLTGFHNVGPKPPTESGSHPPSPVPDTTGSCVSKENASEKSGAAVGKGSIKKRGRNRPRKQESAGSKGSN